MSRLREHRVRMDTSTCPDTDGCERLYHGSLVSGMVPGDAYECCGQTWDPTETPRPLADPSPTNTKEIHP